MAVAAQDQDESSVVGTEDDGNRSSRRPRTVHIFPPVYVGTSLRARATYADENVKGGRKKEKGFRVTEEEEGDWGGRGWDGTQVRPLVWLFLPLPSPLLIRWRWRIPNQLIAPSSFPRWRANDP